MLAAEDFGNKQDTGCLTRVLALPTEGGLSVVPEGQPALTCISRTTSRHVPAAPVHPSLRLPSSGCVTPYLLLTVSANPSIRPAFRREESGNCLQNLLLSHPQETCMENYLSTWITGPPPTLTVPLTPQFSEHQLRPLQTLSSLHILCHLSSFGTCQSFTSCISHYVVTPECSLPPSFSFHPL